MLRIDQIIGACGVTAALVAATFLAMPARAEAPLPTAPSAVTKKKVVSPYARAAAQHERVGEAPVGHAPTRVQGMGKPHKPHAGAPRK
ncbi:MAG: hypothetical protein QOI88_3429 [Gammaproteobacteria bacterium]|jgi:hypothetical protein|nr:hypothetical protein [Gammaproteobacteria bacterium]